MNFILGMNQDKDESFADLTSIGNLSCCNCLAKKQKVSKDEMYFGFNMAQNAAISPMLTSNNIYDMVHKDFSESSDDEIHHMTARGLNSRANSQWFRGDLIDINDVNEDSSSCSEDDEQAIIYTGGYCLGKEDDW
jgi:hypothetical protein